MLLILVVSHTHVFQGPDTFPQLAKDERAEYLSAPKVNDLDGIHVRHHDVLWFNVQMQDLLFVEIF